MRPLTPILLMAATLCACDAPVVGSWRSDRKHANGKRNHMAVNSDLTGDAIVYATTKSDRATFVRFEFDLEWEDNVEDFRFDMECKEGPCDGSDFKMTCEVVDELNGEVDKLDCKAKSSWSDYPFDWERDEE